MGAAGDWVGDAVVRENGDFVTFFLGFGGFVIVDLSVVRRTNKGAPARI